ncbi:hypothetical protein BVRB_9g207260 [Beta vulgaris subsp. vulgaris]|nr:hypothetical protein BVRB_9g207260 [Beta vulgaris subsp. vulgaris]
MLTVVGSTVSYENNLMLAAILCLLLVILFVLLLHIYARWLLAEGHLCRTSIAGVFGRTAHLQRSHTTSTTYTYDLTSLSSCLSQTKGLDVTVIDSIPSFIYGPSESPAGEGQGYKEVMTLECAICLSVFEEREVGKSLPRCSHAFHLECIDMWLFSHSTCPICRAQVVVEVDNVNQRSAAVVGGDGVVENEVVVEETSLNLGTIDDANQIAVRLSDQVIMEIEEISADSDDQQVVTCECRIMVDCSLTRILSRNRLEQRVHPSADAT